jgi:hypothetical protein
MPPGATEIMLKGRIETLVKILDRIMVAYPLGHSWLMTRRWVLLTVALVFGLPPTRGRTARQAPVQKAQKAQKATPPSRVPLQIYLAKGGADACGGRAMSGLRSKAISIGPRSVGCRHS